MNLDPAAEIPVPHTPPRDWFESTPDWFDPNGPLIQIDWNSGRVAALVAPYTECILDGTDNCWTPPPSKTNYEYAHVGVTVTDDGEQVRTANIGGSVNHANIYANASVAADHYANTATRKMRGRYKDEPGVGIVFLGAMWPGTTTADAIECLSSALSGDWRYVKSLNDYEMCGSQLVNNPGFRPVPARAASLTLTQYACMDSEGHEKPAVMRSGWDVHQEGSYSLAGLGDRLEALESALIILMLGSIRDKQFRSDLEEPEPPPLPFRAATTRRARRTVRRLIGGGGGNWRHDYHDPTTGKFAPLGYVSPRIRRNLRSTDPEKRRHAQLVLKAKMDSPNAQPWVDAYRGGDSNKKRHIANKVRDEVIGPRPTGTTKEDRKDQAAWDEGERLLAVGLANAARRPKQPAEVTPQDREAKRPPKADPNAPSLFDAPPPEPKPEPKPEPDVTPEPDTPDVKPDDNDGWELPRSADDLAHNEYPTTQTGYEQRVDLPKGQLTEDIEHLLSVRREIWDGQTSEGVPLDPDDDERSMGPWGYIEQKGNKKRLVITNPKDAYDEITNLSGNYDAEADDDYGSERRKLKARATKLEKFADAFAENVIGGDIHNWRDAIDKPEDRDAPEPEADTPDVDAPDVDRYGTPILPPIRRPEETRGVGIERAEIEELPTDRPALILVNGGSVGVGDTVKVPTGKNEKVLWAGQVKWPSDKDFKPMVLTTRVGKGEKDGEEGSLTLWNAREAKVIKSDPRQKAKREGNIKARNEDWDKKNAEVEFDGPTKTYKLPNKFYEEHLNIREQPPGKVQETKSGYTVELDQRRYDNLYSDALQYVKDDELASRPGARAAAEAVLKRLDAEGRPGGGKFDEKEDYDGDVDVDELSGPELRERLEAMDSTDDPDFEAVANAYEALYDGPKDRSAADIVNGVEPDWRDREGLPSDFEPKDRVGGPNNLTAGRGVVKDYQVGDTVEKDGKSEKVLWTGTDGDEDIIIITKDGEDRGRIKDEVLAGKYNSFEGWERTNEREDERVAREERDAEWEQIRAEQAEEAANEPAKDELNGPTKVYNLPQKFYDDHVGRDLPSGKEIRRTKRDVYVELDQRAYDELMDDADYYSDDATAADMGMHGLASSARAVKRRLAKAGPPTEADGPENEPEERAPEGPERFGDWDADRLQAEYDALSTRMQDLEPGDDDFRQTARRRKEVKEALDAKLAAEGEDIQPPDEQPESTENFGVWRKTPDGEWGAYLGDTDLQPGDETTLRGRSGRQTKVTLKDDLGDGLWSVESDAGDRADIPETAELRDATPDEIREAAQAGPVTARIGDNRMRSVGLEKGDTIEVEYVDDDKALIRTENKKGKLTPYKVQWARFDGLGDAAPVEDDPDAPDPEADLTPEPDLTPEVDVPEPDVTPEPDATPDFDERMAELEAEKARLTDELQGYDYSSPDGNRIRGEIKDVQDEIDALRFENAPEPVEPEGGWLATDREGWMELKRPLVERINNDKDPDAADELADLMDAEADWLEQVEGEFALADSRRSSAEDMRIVAESLRTGPPTVEPEPTPEAAPEPDVTPEVDVPEPDVPEPEADLTPWRDIPAFGGKYKGDPVETPFTKDGKAVSLIPEGSRPSQSLVVDEDGKVLGRVFDGKFQPLTDLSATGKSAKYGKLDGIEEVDFFDARPEWTPDPFDPSQKKKIVVGSLRNRQSLDGMPVRQAQPGDEIFDGQQYRKILDMQELPGGEILVTMQKADGGATVPKRHGRAGMAAIRRDDMPLNKWDPSIPEKRKAEAAELEAARAKFIKELEADFDKRGIVDEDERRDFRAYLAIASTHGTVTTREVADEWFDGDVDEARSALRKMERKGMIVGEDVHGDWEEGRMDAQDGKKATLMWRVSPHDDVPSYDEREEHQFEVPYMMDEWARRYEPTIKKDDADLDLDDPDDLAAARLPEEGKTITPSEQWDAYLPDNVRYVLDDDVWSDARSSGIWKVDDDGNNVTVFLPDGTIKSVGYKPGENLVIGRNRKTGLWDALMGPAKTLVNRQSSRVSPTNHFKGLVLERLDPGELAMRGAIETNELLYRVYTGQLPIKTQPAILAKADTLGLPTMPRGAKYFQLPDAPLIDITPSARELADNPFDLRRELADLVPRREPDEDDLNYYKDLADAVAWRYAMGDIEFSASDAARAAQAYAATKQQFDARNKLAEPAVPKVEDYPTPQEVQAALGDAINGFREANTLDEKIRALDNMPRGYRLERLQSDLRLMGADDVAGDAQFNRAAGEVRLATATRRGREIGRFPTEGNSRFITSAAEIAEPGPELKAAGFKASEAKRKGIKAGDKAKVHEKDWNERWDASIEESPALAESVEFFGAPTVYGFTKGGGGTLAFHTVGTALIGWSASRAKKADESARYAELAEAVRDRLGVDFPHEEVPVARPARAELMDQLRGRLSELDFDDAADIDILRNGSFTHGANHHSTLRHEYGHVVDSQLSNVGARIEQRKAWYDWYDSNRDIISREITEYAGQDRDERFAETYAIVTSPYFDQRRGYSPETEEFFRLFIELIAPTMGDEGGEAAPAPAPGGEA